VAVIAISQKKTPTQRSNAIMVEVGIALGREIPTLVIARTGVNIPALSSIPRIEFDFDGDPGQEVFLSTQIGLFIRGVRTGIPRKAEGVTKMLSSNQRLSHESRSLNFEARVGNLLRDAGMEASEESPTGDERARADFVSLVPGLETELGIVLIEAKTVSGSPDGSRRLRDATRKLSEQVLISRAGLGLLIHDGKNIRLQSAPLVAIMSIDELADQLRSLSLPEILRRARNEAIHAR
jgi:hypothetical protein